MRTFSHKQQPTQGAKSASSARPGQAFCGQSRAANSILHLQSTIGNQAVQRLLRASAEELEANLTPTAPARFAHDFSRIPLHAKAHAGMQPKLTISTPGDIYEQEAERVAHQVMRVPEPQRQGACAFGGRYPKCGQEDDGQEQLQAKYVQARDTGETTAPPIVQDGVSSPGLPLDRPTRGFMESRFGYDFSRVRLHTNPRAAESARAVSALAYTVGPNIVFGAGQYAPATESGKKLIAHELTHVLQQRATFSSRRPRVTANRTAGTQQYVPTATVQRETSSSIICEGEALSLPYTYRVNILESFRMPFFCLRNRPNLRINTNLRLTPAPPESQSCRLELYRGSEHARTFPEIGRHTIPIDGSAHTMNFPGIGAGHYHLMISRIPLRRPLGDRSRLQGNVRVEPY